MGNRLPVYWPGGKRTHMTVPTSTAPVAIATAVVVITGWLFVWSLAAVVWIMFGYWLLIKYTFVAAAVWLGTMLGIATRVAR